MQDEEHTKAELLQELDVLRRRVCKLGQSEKQLKELFDNAVVGIYRTTPDGRFILANTAFVRMLGFSSFEELSGKKVGDEEFTPGYPRSTFKDLIEKKGKVIGFESSFLRRDGTTIFVRENARVVRDSSGRVLYYEGVVEDITERKKVEERLKQYQLMVESAQDAIFFKDLKSRYIVANKKTLEAFGLSGEQVIGKNDYEIMLNKEEAKKNIEDDNLVFRTGKPVEITKQMTSADGKNRWFQAIKVPQFDDKGKITGLVGVARDITEYKKVEEGLKQYQLIVESAQDPMLFKDLKSRYIVANKTALQALGLPREQVIGRNDSEVLRNKDEARMAIEDNNVVFRTGKPRETVRQFTLADGRSHWFHIVKVPHFDDKGKVVGLVSVGRDVTKLKKTEDELREEKLRYQTLFESAPVGIGIATREGQVLECNDAMLQMTGYSLEEFKQINLADTYQEPRSRQMLLRRLQKDGFVRDFEVQLKRKDGATYYASLTIAPITLDGRDVLLTVQEDITERKLSAEILEKSESKYRTLLENLPRRIFLKDTNSVYVSCNENYARDIKIKPEEIAGKTDYDFYPKKLAEKYRADDKRIMEGGKTEDIEEKYIQDRKEAIVHTVKTPVKDQRGSVIGILGIFWDITEQKRAQEMLNNYREKMAQAEQLASLGALSATFAHELTQPLTVINLSIENVLAELKAASRNRSVIEQLEDGLSGVVNATSIIDRFRNFARKSSEKTFGKVDLKAVAEKITKLLNERARRAKVSLRMKGLGNLPPIYSNERELEQLFFALLDNAIQAADGKKDRKVLVSGTMRDEHIELRFSDDCGGIAPEHIGKIFEPFFTTKPPGEGTGLGLCIVQRIVAQAGGRIRVKNKPGTGLTFFVTLPLGKSRRPW